jgi:hypothetical protein
MIGIVGEGDHRDILIRSEAKTNMRRNFEVIEYHLTKIN